jgi:hypothetical protein
LQLRANNASHSPADDQKADDRADQCERGADLATLGGTVPAADGAVAGADDTATILFAERCADGPADGPADG